MRRRQFLRSGVALAVATTAVPAAGRAGDPYRPLGSVSVPGATEVVTDGDTAFVANRTGFVAVDVRDPRRPTRIATVEDIAADRDGGPLQDVWDAKLAGDRLVVAGPAVADRDALHGFAVYDVRDPAAPEQVAFQPTDHAIHNCDTAGDHVYVPETDTPFERLLVFDVSGEPELVGSWSLPEHDDRWETVYHTLYQLHDLRVHDDVAYLAQWDAGVVVLDVSDPADPAFRARFGGRPRDHLHEVSFESARARAEEGLQPPGNAHAVGTDERGNLLAVGRESWDLDPADDRGGPSGIDLYDVSDPSAPRALATIDPPPGGDQTPDGRYTTAHNFDIADGRLYSSWYHGGVKIHDVSDPAAPEELTWWQRPAETTFWAARHAPGRDVFVASNVGVEPDYGDGSLYTFPDRAAPDAAPATAPARTPTPSPGPTTTSGRGTERSTERTASAAGSDTTTSDASGVGALGALGAAGLAGWVWRKR